ncbi:MAG TPA: hypothetical protein VK911_08160, partial [Vicinamibacterales bacterium]|nr:hypothetical protein [Vicinamibacterales bacterium]
ERIEPKILRQFARLGTPAVRDVKVEWAGAEVTLQAPHRPPSIFNGEAGTLYARFRQPRGQVTVTLRGQAEGKEVSWSLPVDAAAAEPGNVLATLAARAAIRDLEEGTNALHDKRRGSAQGGRREDAVKKAIVALATTYRLASRETSFVAIEKREEGAEQPAAELRRVPVALTKGWGGVDRRRLSCVASCVLAAAPLSSARYDVVFERDDMLQGRSSTMAAPEDLISACRSSVASSRASRMAEPSPASRVPVHMAVVVLQQADGSWRLDAALARELGISLAELRALANSIGEGSGWESLVATLAALRFLRERAWDACDEWRLLAEKAEEWLAGALASLPAGARADIERQVTALL